MRFVLMLMILFCAMTARADDSVLVDDFEEGLDPAWEEKVFEGKTSYSVVREDSGRILCAKSEGSASGLILEKEIDLGKTPILAWRWRVDGVLEKGDARTRVGDDYAARVYVIFPHWVFWKTRSINYIWANKLPKGKMIPNSFTSNAMMIAVRSGPRKVGQWIEESRNVREDFKKVFGEDSPPVGAVAIMTDADNTGGSVSACYDNIRFISDPAP